MEMNVPGYVSQLMEELYDRGYECYVVGGAVRSFLLGLPVHDYDLTTGALPHQMKEVFRKYKTIETGIRHGTLTVISDHHPVEITTFRKDSGYEDHRHPDSVEFSSAVREDCARRDFTVNAVCWSKKTGFLDFFGGMQDLERGIIRCIGDPQKRFDEDALRILRALRFAAVLNFRIEEKTGMSLREMRDLLKYVSMERIQAETEGFLKAERCAFLLNEYRCVFEVFIPELSTFTHGEWEDTVRAISASAPEASVRMALLIRNTEHPEEILRRLKYKNETIRTILNLIELADMPVNTRADLRRILSRLKCDPSLYTDFRCAADADAGREHLETMFAIIREDNDCVSLSGLPVSGNDLKQIGFEGKQIGDMLSLILDEVMADRLTCDREEIIAFAKGRISG